MLRLHGTSMRFMLKSEAFLEIGNKTVAWRRRRGGARTRRPRQGGIQRVKIQKFKCC